MTPMADRIEQAGKGETGTSRTQQTRVTWVLLAILGIAFGLRVWGIGFGLPYELTYDEGKEIHRAFKLGVGEYYWKFGKGGLYYILFVEYGLLYVVWWLVGWVGSPREFALLFVQDPSAFFLAGRLTVAVMGALTCLVIFLIGRRIYDWRVGLGAAFIGATAYYHGMHSHTINVDIGMTLALWASILAYVKYEEKKERRWLIGAGALGGIAIAFKLPGAIVLLPLLLAIGSHSERWQFPRQRLKEAGIVLLVTLATLTVVAPEWTTSMTSPHKSFSRILEKEAAATGPHEGDFDDAINSVTISRGKDRMGYFKSLLNKYNLALTFTALLGVGFGLLRRHRWDIIWTVLIVVFLGIMVAADRAPAERYLLPIMPGLWLLSSRTIAAVSGRRLWLMATGLLCVVSLPLVALARHDIEWTKPDTRVLAKEWIEANVPSGSKILMDGTRYRFVMSPPLTPDKNTVARHISGAGAERKQFARGLSQKTLALYAEAMEQVEGPRYELHSTIWGLGVEDLTYYIQTCFDYIITSSRITRKYASGTTRERFPQSARFYEQLHSDPRFLKVYCVEPAPWKRTGPIITVYNVHHTCQTSQKGAHSSHKRPHTRMNTPNAAADGQKDNLAAATRWK